VTYMATKKEETSLSTTILLTTSSGKVFQLLLPPKLNQLLRVVPSQIILRWTKFIEKTLIFMTPN
jgi:hypothetical protein